jgi:subtilase family serine protease
MVEGSARKSIGGSGPLATPGTMVVGAVDEAEPLTVTLLLRRRATPPSAEVAGTLPLSARQFLTSEEFETKYGADPDDVARIRAFATGFGLETKAVSLEQRMVTLSGKAADLARAFSVGLARFASNGSVYRGHVGPPSVPEDIAASIVTVLGFDDRPVGRPSVAFHPGFGLTDLLRAHEAATTVTNGRIARAAPQMWARLQADLASDDAVKNLSSRTGSAVGEAMLSALNGGPPAINLVGVAGAAAKAQRRADELATRYQSELGDLTKAASQAALLAYLNALGIYTPPQIADLYKFPSRTDGTGQCIGIIELGGGYSPADVETYFTQIGVPKPTIVDVEVMGGANRPMINRIVDSEVCLDIEVSGSVAPGAKLACYFAPCTARGFVGAISAALHDRVNRPSTISISWSVSEYLWLGAREVIAAFEDVLMDAALLGVTVCCASGDYGVTSEIHNGFAWVDYPSSSPHILACGGTTINAGVSAPLNQVAWNTLLIQGQATGGGVSELFPLPTWQEQAGVPPSINYWRRVGRGIPDVASVSDPLTGYFVRVDGASMAMAGTSSSAPMWCALLARIAQSVGTRLGYINPLLYELKGTGAFEDIVWGDNGGYSAGPGWDACTGLGVPNGSNLLKAMMAKQ